MFNRYMGVDYSGALTPTASLNGLRVYVAEGDAVPAEVAPPPSLRKYWSRRGIAEWLVERLSEGVPTLVGIDHSLLSICFEASSCAASLHCNASMSSILRNKGSSVRSAARVQSSAWSS